MAHLLEKFKIQNTQIKLVFILIFTYFIIPGNLKFVESNVIFRFEEIFLFTAIFFVSLFTYRIFNKDQRRLFINLNLILISIYIINIIFFFLINNLQEFLYLKFSLINSFIYFFSLLNLFLLIFYYNKKTEIFFDFFYILSLFLIFEFIIFFILNNKINFLSYLYPNPFFEFNGKKYLLFRSVFIGDHISTSVFAVIFFFANILEKKKRTLNSFVLFILIIIIFINFESRLNIFNTIFCIFTFLVLKILNIKINWKYLISLILVYVITTILINFVLSNTNFINTNSLSDRMVLNLFNIDTYFNLPIALGFDNLKFQYTLNNNIILKDLIYFFNFESTGIGTIAALGTNFYFESWNTITSPHNILFTYFSTMGIWFVFVILSINKFCQSNFEFKENLIFLISVIIIFSFWNQIWHIDIIFITLISLIFNESIRYAKKF